MGILESWAVCMGTSARTRCASCRALLPMESFRLVCSLASTAFTRARSRHWCLGCTGSLEEESKKRAVQWLEGKEGAEVDEARRIMRGDGEGLDREKKRKNEDEEDEEMNERDDDKEEKKFKGR